MAEVVAPVRLPIDMGNHFDEFDKSMSQTFARARSSPTYPRAVHVSHSHYLLIPVECETIFRWFHDKRLQCDGKFL